VIRPLILSYYFPPVGGAGAQRPAKFVRHLHSFGHSPVVITGPGTTIGRWTPRDETLSEEVPAGVDVRRAVDEPVNVSRWRSRGERWLWMRPVWSSWWVNQCLGKGSDVGDADVIYALMSPYASADAAYRLSRALGKPWIADLGDPWALDEMMIYPTALHRWRDLQRMRRLLGTAAAIVMTTGEAVRRIRAAFPELAGKPIVSIPCGFDAEDFAGPAPHRSDGAFRIVHTGYLHTELGRQQRRQALARRILGGGFRGADIGTRSHVKLLEAVDRLIAREPALAEKVEIHLAGVLSPEDRELAEQSQVVRLLGYLPHRETLALMRSADLLFLPMQNLPPGQLSGTVPGKTYEYLASQRPILAAVPEGDARDILLAAGTAHVCAPDDAAAMAETVLQVMTGPALSAGTAPGFLERFEYRNLATQVAELMEDTCQQRSARPRSHLSSLSSAAPPITSFRARTRQQPEKQGPHLLLLAYYFPPIGGAGAQRSLKLARYLPDFGCKVTVITGSGTVRGRWSPTDATLLAELPESVEVHRLSDPEPVLGGRWRSRCERWLRVESTWSEWWIKGIVEQGLELADDVDVIMASMSPYTTAKAAAILSEKLGKPWIAGLRDPWALDEMMIYPTRVHRRLELRQMRRLLGTAAATVMTTPEAARRIRASFPELAKKPVLWIPNGFDSDDFQGRSQPRSDGSFRIVHSGYLHTDLGRQQRRASLARRVLGGAVENADILTRSHVYLLEAIARVVERDPSLESVIELHLAGVLSSTDLAASGESRFVRMLGYLSHHEAVGLMRSADLLFLPMQNLPAGVRSGTVPGKTYEYLASRRPILAAVPEGDARDLLLQTGTAHVCEPNDVQAMVVAIEAEISRWRAGRQPPEVGDALLERFERRRLAAQLAAAMETLTGAPAAEAPALPHRLSA
jgi:glycosyltransferase involved in cell wall biosynthesis